jgi:D-sedoheptulose 7-phosphate isomerase
MPFQPDGNGNHKMSSEQKVQQCFQHAIATMKDSQDQLSSTVSSAAEKLVAALLQGGKIIACGNGGSAALAQYFALLLISRYQRERPGLPAVALSSSSIMMSGIAIDQQFRHIFSSQIRALAQSADILVVFNAGAANTSIREAINAASDRSLPIILIHNEESAELAGMLQSTDVEIRTPAPQPHRCQEVQTVLIHCLCELIDLQIFGEEL